MTIHLKTPPAGADAEVKPVRDPALDLLQKAEEATDQIFAAVGKAGTALLQHFDGEVVNVHRILVEPSLAAAALDAAIADLAEARKLIAATEWPANETYS